MTNCVIVRIIVLYYWLEQVAELILETLTKALYRPIYVRRCSRRVVVIHDAVRMMDD